MGAYGNHICQTPNLDRLAKKGKILMNAFTSVSSCSPSRAQMFTGMPSHMSGMYGLHQGVHHFNVFDNIPTLPKVLRKLNVFTGIVGKKHVGPAESFNFDYEETEENHSINQIGRNITNIKNYVRKFLQLAKINEKQFFLIVGFHDPHRCGHISPQYGEFCERWGSGEDGMGIIPDWKPIYYDWRNFPYPENIPQTDIVRQELSAQYMTISRLDQGVGLVLNEINAAGYDKDTYIIYTSDNGPPFPGGRTNLYDYGARVPFLCYHPDYPKHEVLYKMLSLDRIYSSIISTFDNTQNESYHLSMFMNDSDHSINENSSDDIDLSEIVYGSHNFHEITMNYPIRMIRTKRYKLIHNLNYPAYFPIDQDFYTSPTFQEMLNYTVAKQQIPWIKQLKDYYQRPEWEMYDLKMDPLERWNIANKESFKGIRKILQDLLYTYQMRTKDPWRCAPHGILENQGIYKNESKCFTLAHNLI